GGRRMSADPATGELLVVELFTEELPPKARRRLGQAFADGIAAGLRQRGLVAAGATVTPLATPRRLGVSITGLLAVAPDAPGAPAARVARRPRRAGARAGARGGPRDRRASLPGPAGDRRDERDRLRAHARGRGQGAAALRHAARVDRRRAARRRRRRDGADA